MEETKNHRNNDSFKRHQRKYLMKMSMFEIVRFHRTSPCCTKILRCTLVLRFGATKRFHRFRNFRVRTPAAIQNDLSCQLGGNTHVTVLLLQLTALRIKSLYALHMRSNDIARVIFKTWLRTENRQPKLPCGRLVEIVSRIKTQAENRVKDKRNNKTLTTQKPLPLTSKRKNT